MVERSIVIFPQFGKEKNLIQGIRDRYDPLANKIAPHITLVFPFESEITSYELCQHLTNSLYEFESFNLTMQGISYEPGNYLFLNFIQGQEKIIEIHDLLYSKLLARFLSKNNYKPHLTVGRFENSDTAKTAMKKLNNFDRKLEIEVNKITTEIVLNDLSSKIDFEIKLK